MTGMNSDEAARALAAADERRRSGAALVVTASRWDYLTVFLLSLLWGSSWDFPASLRWLPLLVLGVGVLGYAIARRRRARPLPVPLGWRAWTLVYAAAAVLVAATLGLGLALRGAGVPLPFTLSGVVLGGAVVVLVRALRRWRHGYVERVARERW